MRSLALVVVLAGCVTAPPAVTQGDAERAHVELAELQQGRSLLVRKCAGCHRAPLPTDHHAQDWPVKIDEMADRAHVDADQRRMIAEYLVAMSH